jgi:uncharacterized protein YjiK
MVKAFTLLISIPFLLLNLQNANAQQKGLSYELTKPEKFVLPNALIEISGITFPKGNSDILFAHQDEEGILFYFRPGDKVIKQVQFGKKGDYEDIAICGNTVVLLRSDGVLFTFPLSEALNGKINKTKKWEGFLPSGEYESLAFDPQKNVLIVLCKVCKSDKEGKKTTGTILRLSNEGKATWVSQFSIDTQKIAMTAGKKKGHFQPSALTKNILTKEWFVLASVNKLLVVFDENWNFKSAYPLNPSVFLQPEGIAFDSNNNLYISNEGDKVNAGNLLKFKQKR